MSQPVPRGGDARKHWYRSDKGRDRKGVSEVYIIEKVTVMGN